ncbi:hypothetical protein FACS189440_17290 [Bacteroidia bacterium]|nr:hypothetical protein FACS189440_17290 [Bacteroidia bacterium]
MKKFLFTAVLLLSMVTLTFAQGPGGGNRLTPEESAKRQTEWMKTELKLTADQVVKVDSINLVFAKRQAELFQKAQNGGDRTQMREDFQKLAEEQAKALELVLTKEQMEAYKKRLETQRANRGNRGGGGNRN